MLEPLTSRNRGRRSTPFWVINRIRYNQKYSKYTLIVSVLSAKELVVLLPLIETTTNISGNHPHFTPTRVPSIGSPSFPRWLHCYVSHTSTLDFPEVSISYQSALERLGWLRGLPYGGWALPVPNSSLCFSRRQSACVYMAEGLPRAVVRQLLILRFWNNPLGMKYTLCHTFHNLGCMVLCEMGVSSAHL